MLRGRPIVIAFLSADCGCAVAGITDNGDCSETGQCNCKSNVTGLQCSECVQGYWNISADNEHGCQGETCSIDLKV